MAIKIHHTTKISTMVDIEDSIKGSFIQIGANSQIDSFVKIKPAGGSGNLVVGSSVFINSGCVFYTGNGIFIGNNVSIAANCTFAPTNHEFSKKDILIQKQGFRPSKGGIIVEDDVWISAGVVLLDGAILRTGCVIGAMSVVNNEVPAYTICAGNPLKIIGKRK